MSEINAIATNNYLLATQQEVSHDNTLSGNGTVDSPLGVVPGYNETVLYSGTAGTSAVTLNEPMNNFERIKLVHNTQVEEIWGPVAGDALRYWHFYGTPSQGVYKNAMVHASFTDNTHITNTSAKTLLYPITGTATAYTVSLNDTYALNTIRRVIGINRKA
jgi:hypothetical protein